MIPALEVRDLSVAYGKFVALHDVDLEVAEGEIVALLGASGSGKSTLLRAIAGLEPVAAGDIRMHGHSDVATPTHERGCGMVFQDGQLFPHRSVGRNIAYGLETTGMPRTARAERVAEMLELVGLEGYESRSVATLSGGQAQRVALARALAPAPQLLLLDEPLSALDRALRERLSVELRDIIRASGISAVHVTHDQQEAFAIADRIAIMIDGRIGQIGSREELLGAPASIEVRDFLGADGRVRGRIVEQRPTTTQVELLDVVTEVRGMRGEPGDEVSLRIS